MKDLANDKNLQKIADLIIKKLEEVSGNYKKPWFSTVGYGLPQNLNGRVYNGRNYFPLMLLCAEQGYQTPVFMTFQQAKEQNIHINKGEKSFPVLYWNFDIKDMNGNKISLDEYNELSEAEQQNCDYRSYSKYYYVFNIDQSNFAELYPERLEEIKQQFKIPELKDEQGLFCCPDLDHMIKNDIWLCPIISKYGNKPCYLVIEDKIEVPLKGQYISGEAFYSDLLHEVAHSTGADGRLNREILNHFGTFKYGKEELVAELTSAVACHSLGIVSTIDENSTQYLKNWINAINTDSKFIYTILSDVGKASSMILKEISKVKQLVMEQEHGVLSGKDACISQGTLYTQSSSFENAINAAKEGDFQPLVNLKNNGFIFSESNIDMLKSMDSKVRVAVETIFKINLPEPMLHLSGSENNKIETQLSLNF